LGYSNFLYQVAVLEGAMKTMKCEQLGGACDKEFRANTFEEIAEMSKNHGSTLKQ